jgi:hypothetical protein
MTTQPNTKTQINLGVKIFDCLFSCACCVLMLYFLHGFIPAKVAVVLSIIIMVTAIVFLFVWNYHENNEKFPSEKVHAWLTGAIRYSVAYTVATYGFAKILKTQFAVMYSRNDTPVGSLSGFELTWNYFGYSYKLAIILAALQIGGGILLLFRRTTLLGVCVLLPVMVNIVLVNMFYSIAVGAFLVSIIITGALTYLLVLNREPLIRAFFNTCSNLPALKLSYFKHVIRLAIMALSFFTIYRYIMNEKPIDFVGKWKVERLERDGQLLAENAWITDINAWKNIYIEEHGGIAMSPNPYIFDVALAKRGKFEYDDKTRKLNIVEFKFGKPADSINVVITQKTRQQMEWVGTSKNHRFKMQLAKVEGVKR